MLHVQPQGHQESHNKVVDLNPGLCRPREAFMLAMLNAKVKCRPNLVMFVNFISYKLINKTPQFIQIMLP